jgi:ABC-2 type transport system permease protein
MIGMSIVLTLVFSGSMGGEYQPTVYIINNDQGELSNHFINSLKSNSALNYSVSNLETATENISKGRAVGGIIIKKDFSNNILEFKEVEIEEIKTKESIEMYQVSNDIRSAYVKTNMLLNVADTLENISKEINLTTSKNLISEVIELGDYYYKYRNPLSISSTILNTEKDFNYLPTLHYILGFGFFFSSFTVVFLVSDILKEKQEKVWQRQLTTPIKPVYNLLSHLLTAFLMGLAQITLVFSISKILTGADWGISLFTLLIAFSSFIFSFTCFGLVLAGLVNTYEQLGTISPIILVASGMLGGIMWPLEIVQSKILLFLSNFMPHKWAMASIQNTIIKGFNLKEFFLPILILISLGLVFLMIGLKLSSKEIKI